MNPFKLKAETLKGLKHFDGLLDFIGAASECLT